MKMEILKTILSVCLYVCATIRSSHQEIGSPDFLHWGDCPNVTIFIDMDLEKYSGLWFDIESVPSEFQLVEKCLIQNYNWTGDQMLVDSRGLSNDSEEIHQISSMDIEMETNDPAYMITTNEDLPDAPYKIIDTDYHNYACVYSCTTFVGFKAEFTWVFGRAPVLAKEFIDRCHNNFMEMNIDPTPMTKIIQEDVCPYWDKLPKMLEESKTQLSKVLGPDNLATGPSPSNTIDQMQSILGSSGSTGTAIQEVIKANADSKPSVEAEQSSNSLLDVQDSPKENKAPHMISCTSMLNLILAVLYTIFMK